MRRALRRAGWALAAGIGMTAPAAAQSPPAAIIGPGGHVVPADEVGVVRSDATIVMTEGQARLEEGQVELAFLADPMLFSYGLGAHVQGEALEVRGYVPNDTVREQALRVAAAQTGLHVVDRLKLHPTLAGHGAVDKPDNICRAARALLEEGFPEHGKRLDVRCDARGHVTVGGVIGSYEDKVLVSRKLRQVPGCSCVVNQLSLAAAQHEAHPTRKTEATAHVDPLPEPVKLPAEPVKVPVTKWEPSPAAPRAAVTPTRKDSDPPTLGMPRVHNDSHPLPPPVPEFKEPPPAAKRVVPPPVNDVQLPEITTAPKRTAVARPVIDVPPPVPEPRRPLPPAAPVMSDRAPATKQTGASLPVIETVPQSSRPALPPVTPPPLPPVVTEKVPAPKSTTPALPVIETAPKPAAPESSRPSLPPAVPEKAPAPRPAATTPTIPALPPVAPAVPEKAPAVKPTTTLPAIGTGPKPAAPESSRPSLPPPLPEKLPAPRPAATTPTIPALPPIAPAVPERTPATKQPTTALPAIDVPPVPEVRKPASPPAPLAARTTAKPAAEKRTAGGSEESFVTQGTITFDDPPPAAKPPAPVKPVVPDKTSVPQKPATTTATTTTPAPQKPAPTKPAATTPAPTPLPSLPPAKTPQSAAPVKPVEGTLLLDPPPSRPQAARPVRSTVPPAPAAPARPSASPQVRLKERIQTACGPAYDVQVTAPKGKNVLHVTITGRDEADGKRLMDQITPILRSPEFTALEINAEVVYPAK